MKNRLSHIAPMLILLAAPWVFYFPAWLEPMALADDFLESWHTARFAMEQLRGGVDPLWNPYICSGFPAIAYSNSGMYSLLNWLHFFLPQVLALAFVIAFNHALSALGVYLFTRRIGVSRESAVFSGLAFAFSGYFIGGFLCVYFLAGGFMIGFVLYALENIRLATVFRAKAFWTTIASIFLAVQLYAGHPQMTVISGFLYGIFIIYHSIGSKGKRNPGFFAYGAVVVALALALTAAIWLPAIELLDLSARSELTYERFLGRNVGAANLLAGIMILDFAGFHYIFWVGAPLVLLAWSALKRRGESNAVMVLAIAAVAMLVIGLGDLTPLWKIFFKIPVFNRLISPERYALGFSFAVACMAGIGWDAYMSGKEPKIVGKIGAAVTLAWMIAALIYLSRAEIARPWHLAVSLVCGAAFVFGYPMLARISDRRLKTAALLFVCLLPSWREWGGPFYKGLDPRPDRKPHFDIVEKAIAGNPPARVSDFVDNTSLDLNIARAIPTHNLHTVIGWSNTTGYHDLILDRYAKLLKSTFYGHMGDIPGLLRRESKALDILNSKVLLFPTVYFKKPSSYGREVGEFTAIDGVQFGNQVDIELGVAKSVAFRSPMFMGRVKGIAAIGALERGSAFEDGEEVGRIVVHGRGGGKAEWVVRAGKDFSETMYPASVQAGGAIDLPLWAGSETEYYFRPTEINRLGFTTYLFNADDAKQGEAVASIKFCRGATCGEEIPIRAGVDTAMWNVANGTAAHRPATVAGSFEGNGARGQMFSSAASPSSPGPYTKVVVKCLLAKKGSGLFIAKIDAPVSPVGVAHTMAKPAPGGPEGGGRLYISSTSFESIDPERIEIVGPPSGSTAAVFFNKITFVTEDGGSWPLHEFDLAIGDERRYDVLDVNDTAVVLRNRNAMPRAWFAREVVMVSPEQALTIVRTGLYPDGSEFDPAKTALIEEPPPFQLSSLKSSGERIDFISYEANRFAIKCFTPAPAFLTLSEIYYPGWETKIDGKPAQTYRADYVIRGVFVPAGEHIVEMEFRPRSVRIGRTIASIAFFTVALAAIILRRRDNT